MSRDLESNMAELLLEPQVHAFFAIQLFFDSQTLKFWSGLGDLTVGSDTYVGSGQMIEVSELNESADISAKGATVTLSGLPSNLLSLVLTEPYQGRKCKIFFGALNAYGQRLLLEDGSLLLNQDGSAFTLSEAPSDVLTEVFTGYVDQMNIDEGAETSVVSVSVESRLIDLQKPRPRRYTDASQKGRFPTDEAFEYVEDLQDKKFQWGR